MKRSTITKKSFLNDVLKEIKALRKHASKEEIDDLNIASFDPEHPWHCIYGQMTGSCESKRGMELMSKSCVRVWDLDDGVSDLKGRVFSSVKNKVNGEYTGQAFSPSGYRKYQYLSSLEGYIVLKKANIKGVIAYLKGESKTVKL